MLIHLAGVGIANMCGESWSGDGTAEDTAGGGKARATLPFFFKDNSVCLLLSQPHPQRFSFLF